MISLIAAIDDAWGLGKDNALLCHLPADLKHFKACTLHKPIIMGRKTFESIGKPLPQRRNIVLSRQWQSVSGIEVVSSLEEALKLTHHDEEVMVIGGSSLFAEALPLATKIYLTRIHHHFTADVYFPVIDESWVCLSSNEYLADEQNAYSMQFQIYQRKGTI